MALTIILSLMAYAVQFGVISSSQAAMKQDLADIKTMLRESYIPREEAGAIYAGFQQQIDDLQKHVEELTKAIKGAK